MRIISAFLHNRSGDSIGRNLLRMFLMVVLVAVLQLGEAAVVKAQDTSKLVQAMNALEEGRKLVDEGKPKSIHLGIEKYKEALAILKEADVPSGEVAALAAIGMAYSTLDEWGNALDYFN